jgi:hypothetical protein
MSDVETHLNRANPNHMPANLGRLRGVNATDDSTGFGTMLAAMTLRPPRERTGLANQVEHVHDEAPLGLYAVFVVAGTPLAIVSGAAPGAGEVRVEVDAATGIPTFTFAAATTSYFVLSGGPLPQDIQAVMAIDQ